MKIAFTVCNRYQLSHALVLASSLKKHNPDRTFLLGWVDRMQLPELPDWVEVIPVGSLEIMNWVSMEQRYYDFELVAACKPFFARHILSAFPECEELAFFSPTTQVFDSFDLIADPSAFLQLSPQRLRPIGQPLGRLDDKRILNTGMYQASSWILHPDGQETNMLIWWSDRMTDRGFLDLCKGMCLDQLWLNYLPIYHERVKTIRNLGWNYGLNAVPGSGFVLTDGKYTVDENPLITLDFAGLEGHHPVWSDHSDLVKDRALWPDLHNSYLSLLHKHKMPIKDLSLPYGQAAPIRSDRRYRKRVVQFLNKVISRIDTFDWTYN